LKTGLKTTTRTNSVRCGLILLLFLVVAACETPIERRAFSEITFVHLPPILLDVAAIDVIVAYQPSLKSSNVEHEFPVPPVTAAQRWAADRLQAVGTSGRAVVTIIEASVVEVALKKSTGLKGLFTVDQSERYDARVRLTVEAVDVNRQVKARAEAEAQRSRTVGEGITLAAREKTWFLLTEALMADFDGAMEEQIRKYLVGFLK
jgi:hypothetical protein